LNPTRGTQYGVEASRRFKPRRPLYPLLQTGTKSALPTLGGPRCGVVHLETILGLVTRRSLFCGRHLLDSFDRFWIENMHGNRKISEYAPDGRTSETVFAIPGFSVGIQQGVAISLWVKHPKRKGEPVVRFRDDIDNAKAIERRAQLLTSLDAKDFDAAYEVSNPRKDNRWSFRPSDVTSAYMAWPSMSKLCSLQPFNGPVEKARIRVNLDGSGWVGVSHPGLFRQEGVQRRNRDLTSRPNDDRQQNRWPASTC